MIRAKFRCNTVTLSEGQEPIESVTLNAVYAEEGVNKEWSKYTPSGTLQMTITNPAAQGKLKQGHEYILDIREAQEGE